MFPVLREPWRPTTSVFGLALLVQNLSDRLLDPLPDGLGIETSIGVCAEAVERLLLLAGPRVKVQEDWSARVPEAESDNSVTARKR